MFTSQESTFHCKNCRPVEIQVEQETNPSKIIKCTKCNYSTTLKFNMDRHTRRQHQKEALNPTEDNISNFLSNENLSKLNDLFEKESITLPMLLSMEIEDFRRMAKDLGINWGDRYTLEKAIQKKAQPASDPIEQITMVESPTLETEMVESLLSEESLEISTQSKDAQSCNFCDMAKKSNNPQHKC